MSKLNYIAKGRIRGDEMVVEHKDLPRKEAMRQAELLAQTGWTVHFKFTCGNCGTRCTLHDPNTLYEYGECFTCGHETKLDMVGFLLIRGLKQCQTQ